MNLPKAPDRYDRDDQDRLRNALEVAITKLESLPAGWVPWSGTAVRSTQNADAPPTLTQVAQAVKAIIDDLIVKAKS